ncbi:MAG: multidrug transporter [Anaerolineae bacterium]
MRKVILRERKPIPPFNEPARDLRILNKPLWLLQRDLLAPYCEQELEVNSFHEIPRDRQETLVYRDNLFFDAPFLAEFIQRARALGKACQVAFSPEDKAIVTHALPLQSGIYREGDYYLAGMWYFPRGVEEWVRPLVMDTEAREIGFYHVPPYMADDKGDLVYWVPLKAFLSIENWVHVYLANSPFGILAEGARFEAQAGRWGTKLRILLRALLERKQFLSCSALVHVGRNTHIDPTAIIQGPTIIGDNCTIGPGAVITNSLIGDNVNIMQGCQVMLSVVSDGCYLPFRAALFMTVLMENSLVAQNACLQMCVVGRDSFVGAGTTFTDFNLFSQPIRTLHNGRLEETGIPVIGGCVGHHCRIGSGFVIYPGRIIESDTVLTRTEARGVIDKNVAFEDGDQVRYAGVGFRRLYPRREGTGPEGLVPEGAAGVARRTQDAQEPHSRGGRRR